MTPFDVLLDARLRLVKDPMWSNQEYPNPLHTAHQLIERATYHLGIRACTIRRPITDELLAQIESQQVLLNCVAYVNRASAFAVESETGE